MEDLRQRIDAADRVLLRVFFWTWAVLAIFAFLLPSSLVRAKDSLPDVARWLIKIVPTIESWANQSPLGGLIGVHLCVGLLVVVPASAVLMARSAPLHVRFSYAFSRPNTTFFKTVFVMYAMLVPGLVGITLYMWFLAGTSSIYDGNTWGKSLFRLMLTNRVGLGVVGGFFLSAYAMFLSFWLMAVFGPLSILINKWRQ